MTKNVFTWGTFDCLHDGHKEFLRNASKLGALHVIVVPSRIKFMNNGYYPIQNEHERREKLIEFGQKNNGIIESVSIDCFEDGLSSMLIPSRHPDIICFGYDQSEAWKQKLIHFLKSKKIEVLVETLSQYNHGIHSSQIQNYHERRS